MSRVFTGVTTKFLYLNVPVKDPQGFTVAGWVKFNTLTGNQTLCLVANTLLSNVHHLVSLAGNKLMAESAAGGAVSAKSNVTLFPNIWIHWAATFASTTERVVFVNGIKTVNTGAMTVTGLNRIAFGCNVENDPTPTLLAKEPLNGLLAHCSFWKTVLSDREILSLVKGLSPRKLNTGVLLEYWSMVRGAGNDIGIKGYLMTDQGNVGTSSDNPRIFRGYNSQG